MALLTVGKGVRVMVSHGLALRDYREEDHPRDHGKFSEKPGAGTDEAEEDAGGRFAKPPASRGEMREAKREGKGKDAKIVLADGTPAPEHIQKIVGKIPPAWTDLKVALDPSVEVQVQARDGKGNPKTVYTPEHDQRTEALKFARTDDMIRNAAIIGDQ